MNELIKSLLMTDIDPMKIIETRREDFQIGMNDMKEQRLEERARDRESEDLGLESTKEEIAGLKEGKAEKDKAEEDLRVFEICSSCVLPARWPQPYMCP